MRTFFAMPGRSRERQGDVRELANRQEHERRSGGLGLGTRDDEIHRRLAIEVRLPHRRADGLEGAVRAGMERNPGDAAQRHHAACLLVVRTDVAAAPGRVDGHALDVERVAVEQHVRERVLVVEFVVGIGVDDDRDASGRLRRQHRHRQQESGGRQGQDANGGHGRHHAADVGCRVN